MLPQVRKVPTKPGVFLLNNSQILPQVSWILLAWFMSFHQAWDLRLRQWVSNSYGSLTQKFKTIAGASQPCAMSTWLIRILDDTRLISSSGQFLLYCSLLHPTNVCSHRSLPCTVSPEDHLSCDIGSRSSGSDCQAGVVLGSLNSHHNGHMKSRGKNDASSQIHDTAPVSHTLDITWHLDISWLIIHVNVAFVSTRLPMSGNRGTAELWLRPAAEQRQSIASWHPQCGSCGVIAGVLWPVWPYAIQHATSLSRHSTALLEKRQQGRCDIPPEESGHVLSFGLPRCPYFVSLLFVQFCHSVNLQNEETSRFGYKILFW